MDRIYNVPKTYAELEANKIARSDDGCYEYSDLIFMFNKGFKHAIRCVRRAYKNKKDFDSWLEDIIRGCGKEIENE